MYTGRPVLKRFNRGLNVCATLLLTNVTYRKGMLSGERKVCESNDE